ncbi:MAG: deoxyribonuclease V [Gammaproteobacteria bacterium]
MIAASQGHVSDPPGAAEPECQTARRREGRPIRHAWAVAPSEARVIQTSLRDAVVQEDCHGPVRRIAGADVAFIGAGRIARAAIAVLGFPGLDLIEQAVAERPCEFPYVPGLLSFREVPVLLQALKRLSVWPDLVLCDGQGYAHPRRLGLACHLGLCSDLPTIGVAKTRLIGRHGTVPAGRGGWTALLDKEETIGAVLRTRVGVRPLFVSVGHRVGLQSAVRFVMACTTRYRLPETTRAAHRLASGP